MNPEYKAALEEIERLDTLHTDALAALWKIADHIPENWGDECRDGYVNLNISADAIEAVEAAICQTPSDIKRKPSDSADLKEQTFEECGCCGHYHRATFRGDCREDSERFTIDEIPEGSEVVDLESLIAEEN